MSCISVFGSPSSPEITSDPISDLVPGSELSLIDEEDRLRFDRTNASIVPN